jgi:hypothetical protein
MSLHSEWWCLLVEVSLVHSSVYLGRQEFPTQDIVYDSCLSRLALFSIQQTDLTSFSEDRRGVKWLCN